MVKKSKYPDHKFIETRKDMTSVIINAQKIFKGHESFTVEMDEDGRLDETEKNHWIESDQAVKNKQLHAIQTYLADEHL